jgi:molybdopterin-guanine dinucleotide biosynthesis protein A
VVESLALADITGLVLAGGRGTRMGGVDKGLQHLHGMPLAEHALQRLQRQQGAPLGGLMLNANRHPATYASLAASYSAQLVSDSVPDYAGPLAGVLAGLEQCSTPYVLTVPCDSPCFPLDLAQRLHRGLQLAGANAIKAPIAVAATQEQSELQLQPVFCLVHTDLREALRSYLLRGGRKFGQWAQQHALQVVVFSQPQDDPEAFANANTLEQLHALAQTVTAIHTHPKHRLP